MRRILVVVANDQSCEDVGESLRGDGHAVEFAPDGRSALEALRDEPFHLLITDWKLPDMEGLELLDTVRAEGLPVGVIVMTAHGDTALADTAMKAHADDFIAKPCSLDQLRVVVRRILDRRALADELESLRRRLREDDRFHEIVSKSPKMRRVFNLIEQVAPHPSTVLIHGEAGTGKELVAQALHTASGRRGPMLALNCAALAEPLLESELFGHERGAFTNDDRRKLGRFELARGGTLLLDEVAEIGPAVQAKLLRVIQFQEFERLGGTETLTADVRLVAASNKRLEDEVRARRFRTDLFYRLNVVRIDLPPLRDRIEDVPLLAEHFLERNREMSNPPVVEIGYEAMQALVDHDWPGNVRELENAIRSAIALADGPAIGRSCLPATIAPRRPPAGASLVDIDRPLPALTEELIARVEREYLGRLLADCRGNVSDCSRRSKLSRRSVAQKLEKYGLDRRAFRGPGQSSLDAVPEPADLEFPPTETHSDHDTV